MHGLAEFFGLNSGGGTAYLWWSGIGSDLGELTIVAAIFAAYSKHACHARHCWRLGKHPVDGTPFIVCRKHHPTLPGSQSSTAEEIAAAAQAAASTPVVPPFVGGSSVLPCATEQEHVDG